MLTGSIIGEGLTVHEIIAEANEHALANSITPASDLIWFPTPHQPLDDSLESGDLSMIAFGYGPTNHRWMFQVVPNGQGRWLVEANICEVFEFEFEECTWLAGSGDTRHDAQHQAQVFAEANLITPHDPWLPHKLPSFEY